MNSFPSISDYNQTIQKEGGRAFGRLYGINIIPSRTMPIKVFLFGSGAYAVVFKGEHHGRTFALRCFLTAEEETLRRYQLICSYLRSFHSSWITPCEFLEDEIEVKGEQYPVVKMDWVEGKPINEFVTDNLSNSHVLSELQRKLIDLSNELEERNVAHGDLQGGNILVSGTAGSFKLRLIDYDGMFVPGLETQKSLEKGRSEFQHPGRTLNDFRPEMDRFSYWVMITALEALKVDKSLWDEVMRGGFNTLDNFLFTVQDFNSPGQSKLFSRLEQLQSPSLKYYLDQLRFSCYNRIQAVPKPALYGQEAVSINSKGADLDTTQLAAPTSNSFSKTFIIKSNAKATVLTTSFKRLGDTPLELDRQEYSRKTVVITDGKKIEQLYLDPLQSFFQINFLEESKPIIDMKEGEKVDSQLQIEEQERLRQAREADERRENIERDLERAKQIREEKERKLREETARMAKEREKREKEEKEKQRQILIAKKKGRRKTVMSLLLVTFLLIGIFSFLYYYEPQENVSTATVEKVEVIDYSSTIRDFLKAEESRDFTQVYPFFASSIPKYYNQTYPSIYDLQATYNNAWDSSVNSWNIVDKIVKVSDYKYNLQTTFHFYNKSGSKKSIKKSVVRFVFDQKGKIKETYGISTENSRQKISQKTVVQKAKRTTENNYKTPEETIRMLLEAEETKNFAGVLSYFSPHLSRYWDQKYPDDSDLKKAYQGTWDIVRDAENHIIEIRKIDNRIYDLETLYTYYHIKGQKWFEVHSVVRYEFNYNGKIAAIYGVERDKGGSSESVGGSTYTGRYLYKTSIDKILNEVAIRNGPSISSPSIKESKIGSTVYVIERTNDYYYRIWTDGIYGYVSKNFLVEK